MERILIGMRTDAEDNDRRAGSGNRHKLVCVPAFLLKPQTHNPQPKAKPRSRGQPHNHPWNHEAHQRSLVLKRHWVSFGRGQCQKLPRF